MATQFGCLSQSFTALLKNALHAKFFKKIVQSSTVKCSTNWKNGGHVRGIFICLNFDEWKTFVTTDEAMFNLGGSYGRR